MVGNSLLNDAKAKKMANRRLQALFIVFTLVAMSLFSACDKSSDEQKVETTTVESMTVETTTAETTTDDIDETTEVTYVSYTMEEIYAKRDNLKIRGKVYRPEGEGPFPVVVLSSCYRANLDVDKDIAIELARNGIAGVCFNFTEIATSGGFTNFSVLTEAADLEAVLNEIMTLDYIDNDNVFLWGHSLGGFVSTYVGCQNPGLISGMMLTEPSYQLRDDFLEYFPEGTEIPDVVYEPSYCGAMFVEDILSFDIYEMMPEYSNDVVIFAGTETPSIGAEYPEYLERAMDTFVSAEFVAIEGEDHMFSGDGRELMIGIMIEFVNNRVE
jgi:dienelactone hydrolase